MLAYVFDNLNEATEVAEALTRLFGLPRKPDFHPRVPTKRKHDDKHGWTLRYANIVEHPGHKKWCIASNDWTEKQRTSGEIESLPKPAELTVDWSEIGSEIGLS